MSKYGDITNRNGALAEKKALDIAKTTENIAKFGIQASMPANATDTVTWRRPVALGPALTPLTEGVSPTAGSFDYDVVSLTLEQFGGVLELTDVIADLHADPVGSDMLDVSAEQAVTTCERLNWNEISAGTNVDYSGTAGAVNAVAVAVSKKDLRRAIKGLKRQKALPHKGMLAPTDKVGTKPIRKSYIAFCHTDLEADLQDLDKFVPVEEYGSMQPLSDDEFGAFEGIRFITNAEYVPLEDAGGAVDDAVFESTSGTVADVYPIVITASKSYINLAFRRGKGGAGTPFKPMVMNPGTPRGGDALGQKGTVGWKMYHATGIANESWIYTLKVACSK